MRDQLLDLVEHTYDLGCIDLIKIDGTDKETTIFGYAQDKNVVLDGRFHTPVAEFIGHFGMPNLGKLKIMLNLPEYKENAKLSITKKANGDPDGVHFENQTGDFHNTYRFMSADIVSTQVKDVKFKGVNWDVEFEPTVTSIQSLRMQAQANSDEPLLQVQVDKQNLKFLFGDHSTHAGNFVFHAGVSGVLKRPWAYPVTVVQSILNLNGDKRVKFSDGGAAEIVVDSGLATYSYIMPAHQK